jgi:hypothetical protein
VNLKVFFPSQVGISMLAICSYPPLSWLVHYDGSAYYGDLMLQNLDWI